MDGSAESIAALETAADIARAQGCALHVVSVLPPFPSYQIDPGLSESRNNTDELRIQLRSASIRNLMSEAGAAKGWTHEVVMGRPARMVTRIAEERGADMIVVGRREHGLLDRISGGETTLQIMRLSAVPVLAVSAAVGHLTRVVVATDFSHASARAARAALALLGRSGTLHLVHVEPPVEMLPGGFALAGDGRYPGDVVQWFRRLVDSLTVPPGVLVETTVLNGKPVATLLEFAERIGADLIAAGSHSHSVMERILLGSVSTGLVRNAKSPVLVAPADA
jgi:nucleotide-binding universal stress UspA family protein